MLEWLLRNVSPSPRLRGIAQRHTGASPGSAIRSAELLDTGCGTICPTMVPQDDDERWMRVAVEKARRGLGSTSPNPAVGAVLAVRGKIVATGFHRRAGAPHAEIECLRNFAAPIPSDATLYVTLEPCSTRGRTGPCTTALISAGVRHVVIGAVDPNPIHRGRGVQLLREAGLNVRVGLLADECNAL